MAAEAADATTVLTSAAPLETTAVVAARALTQFVTIYTTLEFVGIHRTPRLVCDEWGLELVWVQPFWPRSCVILTVHPLEDVLDEQGRYGVEGVPRMPPVAVEVPGLRVV